MLFYTTVQIFDDSAGNGRSNTLNVVSFNLNSTWICG